MGLTTIPRRIAKLEYSAVRLPFTLLDQRVVARHLDDQALLRVGFERLLGSLDGFAGWLLGDDGISRRGHALRRRTEFLAKASELDRKARARRVKAEEKLQAEQARACRARERAQKEFDDVIAAAYESEQEEKQQVGREADARAEAEKTQAEHAAETRAAKAEEAQQAEQKRISAEEDRVSAAAEQQLSDAADKRRLVKYRREEADHLDHLATSERDERRSS